MNCNLHEMSVLFIFFGAHISQYFICHCLKQYFNSFFATWNQLKYIFWRLKNDRTHFNLVTKKKQQQQTKLKREREKPTNVNNICVCAIEYEQHLALNHQLKLFCIEISPRNIAKISEFRFWVLCCCFPFLFCSCDKKKWYIFCYHIAILCACVGFLQLNLFRLYLFLLSI